MILFIVFLISQFSKAQAADLPLESSHYDVQITGGVVEIDVEQVFYNSSEEFIEAIYTFPLDDDSAVDAMSIRMGNRELVGDIQEREAAREIYEAAVRQGRVAGLTEQERPNMFTQSVANIPPGQEITVHLHVVQPVERVDDHYEMVIPLVVGPRFSPVIGVEDVAEITPPVARGETGVEVGIDVDLMVGIPISEVSSPTHDIDARQRRNHTQISLDGIRPNSDFVLRWSVDADEPVAMAIEQDDHIMLRFEAPETPAREVQ